MQRQPSGTGPTPYLFLRFFEIFWSDFRNYFVVFLGSSCRETAKKAIKNRREKTTGFFLSQLFRQKVVYGVFEPPLLRNAQKRHKKNLPQKKEKYLLTPFSGHLPDIRRFHFFSS
jgi:hypothetical protein